MADIKKRSIVWYYSRDDKEWRKGKVVTVNRGYLLIKQRNGKGNVACGYDMPCFPATNPKPVRMPQELRAEYELYWKEYWKTHIHNRKYFSHERRMNLLKRLKIIK